MEEKKVFDIIVGLKEKSISEQQISFLFNYSLKIANRILSENLDKINCILSVSGIRIEDIAVDSTTNLFLESKNSSVIGISNAIKNWRTPIRYKKDALFFLNTIIKRNVNQQICILLKHHDPQFAKFHKSIHYYLKKTDFKKVRYLGSFYIIKKQTNHFRIVNDNDIEILPYSIFYGKTDEIIKNVFQFIKKEMFADPAIPVNLLIRQMRQAYSIYPVDNTEFSEHKMILDESIEQGLKAALAKIRDYYLAKNILTRANAHSIKLCLMDIANDLKDGGLTGSLFFYFKKYHPGLNKSSYENKYRTIIEYLFCCMKNKIALELETN